MADHREAEILLAQPSREQFLAHLLEVGLGQGPAAIEGLAERGPPRHGRESRSCARLAARP